MTPLSYPWTKVWQHLAALFEDIAAQVEQCVPGVTYVISHHHNPAFPFRAYVSFWKTDADSIDISVDCKRAGDKLLISADIAHECGLIIAEYPEQQIDLHAPSFDAALFAAFHAIEQYLRQQLDLICNEVSALA